MTKQLKEDKSKKRVVIVTDSIHPLSLNSLILVFRYLLYISLGFT